MNLCLLVVLLTTVSAKTLSITHFEGSSTCDLGTLFIEFIYPYEVCIPGPQGTRFSGPDEGFFTLDMYETTSCHGSATTITSFSTTCTGEDSRSSHLAELKEDFKRPLTADDVITYNYGPSCSAGVVYSATVGYGAGCSRSEPQCSGSPNIGYFKSMCGDHPSVFYPDFSNIPTPSFSQNEPPATGPIETHEYAISVGTRPVNLGTSSIDSDSSSIDSDSSSIDSDSSSIDSGSSGPVDIGGTLGVNHLSLQLWRLKANSIVTAQIYSRTGKGGDEKYPKICDDVESQVASIELLPIDGWRVHFPKIRFVESRVFRQYDLTDIKISGVYSKRDLASTSSCSVPNPALTDTADLFYVINSGSYETIISQWDNFESFARSYPLAEYCGDAQRGSCGPFSRWPNSKYPNYPQSIGGVLFKNVSGFSNSNTFIKQILINVTASPEDIFYGAGRIFPGNNYPLPPSDNFCGNKPIAPGETAEPIFCPDDKLGSTEVPYLLIGLESPYEKKRDAVTAQHLSDAITSLFNISTDNVMVREYNGSSSTYEIAILGDARLSSTTYISTLNTTIHTNPDLFASYGVGNLTVLEQGIFNTDMTVVRPAASTFVSPRILSNHGNSLVWSVVALGAVLNFFL